MDTKLIKRNLKLIMSINNMQLFLHFTQPNLTFEPSFSEIHEVLREYGFLNINFKLEILAKFEFFCQQTVQKIKKFHSHFQIKSNGNVEITSFS